MKKIIFTLCMLFSAGFLQAQEITGAWYGTLLIQSTKLHVVFHISKTPEGYLTTMDSPDQNVKDKPTDKTTVAGNVVTIESNKIQMKYTGTYIPDSNKINGVFSQRGMSFPLTLTATKDETGQAAPKMRPQDPKDFPYKREEVKFVNAKAGDTLAGTLTIPENGKVSKIVVMITGSGPQNRDEEIVQFNHRPFLVWSDWLTRNGIAVLRFDDRGIGASTGAFSTATTGDFADDAEAAVRYIQSRPDLKKLDIGLMGHSEGGMIAPIVASRDRAIKFLVLLAAPGVPVSQLMMQQTKDQLRLAGAPANVVDREMGLNKKIYALLNESRDLPTDQIKEKLVALMHSELDGTDLSELGGASVEDYAKKSAMVFSSPWFRYFITFDPTGYLSRTKCPVLALNGTLDMQVQASANLAGISSSLKKAGNNKFTVMPMEGLNHLFQKATTGSAAEYGEIEETVNPAALHMVTDFINKL